MRDFKACDLLTQLTLGLQGRTIWDDNHDIHVGRARYSAARCAAKENHTDQRLFDLCARSHEFVQVRLDAWKKLRMSRPISG